MSSKRACREAAAREALGPGAVVRVIAQRYTAAPAFLYLVTCPDCDLRVSAYKLAHLEALWPTHLATHARSDSATQGAR